MLALYLTIWLALLLFVIGETGRTRTGHGSAPPSWAWWTFTLGLALAVGHTLLSFGIVHGWAHDDAVRATAAQTEQVFGVAVGWGVYVNYLFFAVWFADVVWWRLAPRHYVRPAMSSWALRAFYFIVIFNAAVVFAAGPRRVLGLAIVGWLTLIWSRDGARFTAN